MRASTTNRSTNDLSFSNTLLQVREISFKGWNHIGVPIGCRDLKANTRGCGSFKNQLAFGKDAVSQKRRRLVEDHHIDVQAVQRGSEVRHEIEAVLKHP